jgi:glycosyltransferase involved in cell wall biosynthesis
MQPKLIMSINTAWNIFNFRQGLIAALRDHGYDVVALAPEDGYAHRLERLGCRFVALPMDSNGTNPARDLGLLMRYHAVLRAERPLAYLGYTVKPNIYGSLAAHMLGIPVINNIAGLGATFIKRSAVTHVVRMLYKLALSRSHQVFFQNRDDQALFAAMGIGRPGASVCLPGSGMDLTRYRPAPAAADGQGSRFRFLMIARMLRDKGVEEFAAAARLVRQAYPHAQCSLLGPFDEANPNSVSRERVAQWEAEGILRYLGRTDDVRPFISEADCVVLPSYREGVPRSLLEAAAMARPIITTDAVGCREVVDDGINGLLCAVRDANDLAEKMARMIAMPVEQRLKMARQGRRKVEAQFDEQLVIRRYLAALQPLAESRRAFSTGPAASFPVRDKS